MANRKDGPIYVGCSSDLVKRVYEHRNRQVEGHTRKYWCTRLVWFEAYDDIQEARTAERRMKKWNRDWKVRRIVERNPEWKDLWDEIVK